MEPGSGAGRATSVYPDRAAAVKICKSLDREKLEDGGNRTLSKGKQEH